MTTPDRIGTANDAQTAETATQYYTALLSSRLGKLFECQRLSVYWETGSDHVTIGKTSKEHALLLSAGAYNAASRRAEDMLTVDDGWIERKNPDAIVKVVPDSVLGGGVFLTESAQSIRHALLTRKALSSTGAIRKERVYLLSESLLQTPATALRQPSIWRRRCIPTCSAMSMPRKPPSAHRRSGASVRRNVLLSVIIPHKESAMNKNIQKLTYSALYLAIALVLPFLTGQIPQIGSMLCPMHIPALLCGFVCGWGWGLAVGFIAPLLRSVLFGMPDMFPTAVSMAFELAIYGAAAGALYRALPRKTVSVYLSLIIAMIAGRLVWGVMRYLLAGLVHSTFTPALFLAGAVTTAIPGIILHIILIPALVIAMDKARLIPD